MSDIERLLREYIEALGEGQDVDPQDYLGQVEGAEREALTTLMEVHLEQAPRREWDAQAYRESSAPQQVEAITKALEGSAGLWPALLPRLRNRVKLKRADLVAQLAARVGAQEQRDKVADYYNQMEQGRLPAAGVSNAVL